MSTETDNLFADDFGAPEEVVESSPEAVVEETPAPVVETKKAPARSKKDGAKSTSANTIAASGPGFSFSTKTK